MRIIIYILFATVLYSCENDKNQTNKVKLSLINNKIFSKNGEFKKRMSSVRNLLTFRLTNCSENKLYFVLNENNFESIIPFSEKDISDSTFFGRRGRLLYDITTEKNEKPRLSICISDNFSRKKSDDIENRNMIEKQLLKLNYKILYSDYKFSNSVKNNSFVLLPNQTKNFKVEVDLPANSDGSTNVIFNNNENYYFNLLLICDKKMIEKVIPNYKLKELQLNNIYIYNGKLISNKVPIFFK